MHVGVTHEGGLREGRGQGGQKNDDINEQMACAASVTF